MKLVTSNNIYNQETKRKVIGEDKALDLLRRPK